MSRQERIGKVSDWTPVRHKWQYMAECYDHGTKREWLQAEREFWQLLKTLGVVEGEWWRM